MPIKKFAYELPDPIETEEQTRSYVAEKRLPTPPALPRSEESGLVEDVSLPDSDEEIVLEKIAQVRKASDEIVQLYGRIVDVDNWEPEEKWEMIEKLNQLSEAISGLKYPFDLVKQASDHNERMKGLEITGKQIDTRKIEDSFIHKAGEEINRAIEIIDKDKKDHSSNLARALKI